jgi:endonuclease YncB( thermonuclease family)
MSLERIRGTAEYVQLVNQISTELSKGRERARRAVEREKVKTYWEVGKLITEFRGESGHGDHLVTMSRLAEDLQIGTRQLYQMSRFYSLYPSLPSVANMGWSHFLELLAVHDNGERQRYLEEASRREWTRLELRAQIRAGVLPDRERPRKASGDSLPALRGALNTYRLFRPPDAPSDVLRLDLGFKTYRSERLSGLQDPQAGQTVSARKAGSDGYTFSRETARRGSFYTFEARVVDVVDGDTLWLDIDCGFDTWTVEKVRLRGIDTPELGTAEGKLAKDFVEEALADLPFVVVTTTKPDKYDRFLADVFYLRDEEDAQRVADGGLFLNSELLAHRMAKRM